jgi:hypothetical protein
MLHNTSEPRMTFPYQTAVKSFALASILVVGACNPVRETFTAVGAGPNPVAAPDFVQQSRPANLDYIPVGRAVPERPTKARTADEVKAAEAELEGIRARNEAARNTAVKAGSTPAPEPASTEPRRRQPPKTP